MRLGTWIFALSLTVAAQATPSGHLPAPLNTLQDFQPIVAGIPGACFADTGFSWQAPFFDSELQAPSPSVYSSPTFFPHETTQLSSRSSGSEPMSARSEARRVLDYLRDMMDVCRGFHRHDLLREYQDAWEVAVVAIYGALPPRAPIKAHFADVSPTPKPPTFWRQKMLDSPLRKIVRRFREKRRDRRLGTVVTDYELLECGHRMVAGVQLPDSPPAKRRHCSQCAKPVSPAEGTGATASNGAALAVGLPRLTLTASELKAAGGKQTTASSTPAQKKPPAPAASYARAKRRC